MSDSCCGGCGGQAHQPRDEKPAVQEHKPEQGQAQAQELKSEPQQEPKQDK
jgi:hypothetical protein